MRYLLILLIAFSVTSCTDDIKLPTLLDYLTQNHKDIDEYIADSDLEFTKTDSGLYYVIETEGEGDFPTIDSNVTVKYRGYLLNGIVFDKSGEEGISFDLNRVIPGWIEGIQLFKVGSIGKLIIPTDLAYGTANIPGIPAGSALIFDIELLAIVQ
ncbi:MAG: FKBP-type peptidyl-prolyl cis-trans isomerase [Flavobacteriaceae bacterium]|nr:FKBP-type peptidyl-prolyl cis-trans isomerase [Flavobacteriaceae bacterium]